MDFIFMSFSYVIGLFEFLTRCFSLGDILILCSVKNNYFVIFSDSVVEYRISLSAISYICNVF